MPKLVVIILTTNYIPTFNLSKCRETLAFQQNILKLKVAVKIYESNVCADFSNNFYHAHFNCTRRLRVGLFTDIAQSAAP